MNNVEFANEMTQRQRAVLDVLVELHQNGESPPTIARLCEAAGLSSRGSMHKHVSALLDLGLIEPPDGRPGIRLSNQALQLSGMPFLGDIAAGMPLPPADRAERMEVPSWMQGHGRFLLRVSGDSMRDAGIHDGDLVVVEPRESLRPDDLVVAMVDGADTTLKYLRSEGNSIRLIPASADFSERIYSADRVEIQGVVVAQMRQY